MLKNQKILLHIFLVTTMHQIQLRDKTSFKSFRNTSYIDLVITTKSGCFQNTIATSIGLSDCHKFLTTILKASFKKPLPKEVFYKDYKHFNSEDLKEELPTKLGGFVYYDLFENIFRTFR